MITELSKSSESRITTLTSNLDENNILYIYDNEHRFYSYDLFINLANSIMDGHCRSSMNELVYYKK